MRDSNVSREEEIFGDALDVAAAERDAFLIRVCNGDAALRTRVDALLVGVEKAGRFLNSPLATRGAVVPESKSPDVIGRYKLLEKIGEGGCGVVWMAEQSEPVRRRVALKVIKLGMDTREVIVRFEAERQALALMDHPNIARVFDGGATENGRPYFVMELVRGVPITRYCDEHQLTPAARIELFIAVCEAVQHAHQKGIIHRDLKPSNILVTVNDGVPVPKVIDFGIAKATRDPLTDKTLFTAFQQFIGTPVYMSPEQADLSSVDIDTRSDLYSLGVLLYELLTGAPPFDAKTLLAGGVDEIRRIIREVEPPRPSTRVATLGESDRTTLARQRGTAPPRLSLALRGDLDWIVMRCLEKDRARRYETANALAMDLRRHLTHEPIAARPPSTAYLLQKLFRRHRFVFVSAGAMAATLLVGIALSTWQAVRATRAEREQTRLRAVESAQRARAETAEGAALRRAYAADMNLAQQSLAVDNLGRARELLDRHRPKSGEPDLRGWEWRYLWQQCRSDASTLVYRDPTNINALSASADARWLAITANRDGVPALDGVAAVTRSVRDLLTGTETPLPASHGSPPIFSPREPLLAIAIGKPPRMQLWNAATRQFEREWVTPPGVCIAHRFSADGAELLGIFSDNNRTQWQRWRVADGQPLHGPPTTIEFAAIHSRDGHGIAVTGDLRRAAVREPGGAFTLVDVEAGRKLWTLPVGTMWEKQAAFAVARDGSVGVSAGGDGQSVLLLWEGASGRKIGELRGHLGAVTTAEFAPDGRTLVSGGLDQTIRVWDVVSRRLLRTLHGHDRPVMDITLLPNGKTVFSGARAGAVRAWDLTQEPSIAERTTLPDKVAAWRFAADSASVFAVEASGAVTRRSGRDFGIVETMMKLPPGVRVPMGGIAMAPDARSFAISTGGGTVQVWDWERRAMWRELPTGSPVSVPKAFLDGGRKLLIFAGVQKGNGSIQEWDLERGVETRSWPVERGGPLGHDNGGFAAVSTDERLFLLLESLGTLVRIELNTGNHTATPLVLPTPSGLKLSADGQHLAIPSVYNNLTEIWDNRTLRSVATLPAYLSNVGAAAFSPDSRRLFTGGGGAEGVRLWDVQNWEPVLTLPAPSYLVTAAFSPDGNTLGSRDENGLLHLWRAPSWVEIEAAEKEGRWR